MSVAENPAIVETRANVQQQFAISSAVGAVAILAVLGLIFGAIPLYWGQGWESVFAESKETRDNSFLSDALLIQIELVVIGLVVYGGYRLLQEQTQPGIRAGSVIGAVYIFAALWFTFWLGGQMETQFADNQTVGWGVLGVLFAALVAGAGYVYLMMPGWYGLMETLETQGWFHLRSYKPNQGVRVRRGTIAGILAVGVSGIITMATHRLFGAERPHDTLAGVVIPNDLYWIVPFYGPPMMYVYLMFKVHILMPIVIFLVFLWVALRVVNMPVFADFLIATEAEMNKVSWTTRRRLIQDTWVVLATVFFFTMFLFVVDILWIKILSAPYVQVLMYDPREKEKQQQETAKW